LPGHVLFFERSKQMSRKSLWLGLTLAVAVLSLVCLSAGVHAQKQNHAPKPNQNSVSEGPPSLSLTAEPTVIKASEGAHAQRNAAARWASQLRYRWTVNGGRLNGQGPTPVWDMAGLQPGVYQAVAEVDDGRDLTCVAFSSVSVVVLECPPPPRPVCPTINIS